MKYVLAILIFVWSSYSFLQETTFKTFSVREGLAQSQVFSIVHGQNGYLWIGTQGGGLCRFDGEDFSNFTVKNGLGSNTINTLYILNSKLFIGTNNGLTIFSTQSNKVVKVIPFEDPIVLIRKINSDIYFITEKNILGINKNKELNVVFPNLQIEGSRIQDFFQYNNQFYMSTTRGVYHLHESGKVKINKNRDLFFTKHVTYLGRELVGTYGEGLSAMVEKEEEIEIVKDVYPFLDDLIITELFVDSKGVLWVGSQRNGVFRYDDKDQQWERFGEKEGLSNDHVKCITEDKWGQIWTGTSGGGFNRYSGSQFLHYTDNSGLNGNYIFSVLNTQKNGLWLGTSGKGVLRINDTSNVVFNEKNGFFNVKVKALFEDSRGLIWMGTEGKGVSIYYRYSVKNILKETKVLPVFKDTIINFSNGKRFPSTLWVKGFAENKKGEIYMASSGGGLVRARIHIDSVPKITFRNIKIKGEGKLSLRINDLLFSKNDDLYIATNDLGLGVVSNGVLTYYNELNSKISNSLTTIEEGENGVLWFGSNKGIGYLENDSVFLFDENSGLASNNVYQIQSGENGYMWIGTEKGLDRIILVGKDKIDSKHFGNDEGFIGIETSLNASFKDANNNLWFGTVNGLSVYKPKEIQKTTTAPIIFFNSVKVFYDTLFKSHSKLKYLENSLSFSFGSVYLPNPSKVMYQWRLVGFESEWSQISKSNSITYSNLRSGNYMFEVRALIEGNISSPIQFEFTISKPYWKEYWFLIAVWGGGFLIIGMIIIGVVYRYRKRNKEVKKQLQLEKSLIELEQKALRLQMNPHFIFNSLNTIQHLIIEKDEKAAKYYLSKFAKLMRQILENSRERLISIDDEVETLENYLIIEKFGRKDFEYEINIEESINQEEDILPPMMIQPFVENAIIHGLKGLKERKGMIKISFKMMEEYLQFEIEDNGQGRKEAEQQKSQIANYHRSTALKVTQERLDNLNKDLEFKSFEIVDLYNANREPQGTKVILRVKL